MLSELGVLAGWTVLALVAGFGALFVRTAGGREAVSTLDAIVVASLVLAVPPAWFARGLVPADIGPTEGSEAPGWRRGVARNVLRTAVHPFAAVMWGWAALVGAAAGAPVVALVLAGIATLVGLAGLVSAALWLVAPSRPAVHDLVAHLWPAASGSNE